MPSTVTLDIAEGIQATHDFMRGWQITRVAQVADIVQQVTHSGTTTSASKTISMANTTDVFPGMVITGTGIPLATQVVTVVTNTSITITNAATASATVTLTIGTTDTAGLIQAAVGAVIAVTGDRGSPCPGVTAPTYLDNFVPEISDARNAKVKIIYKGYPAPVFEFDGSLNQIETNIDKNGSPITTQYTYPSPYPLDPRKAGLTVTQGGTVSRAIPEGTYTMRFTLTAGTISGVARTATEIMTYYKGTYEGYLNSNSYTIGLLTATARKLLCEKVGGTTRDGGITYDAFIVFHYKPQGWDPTVTFINPDDGKPPADLVPGTGSVVVEVLPDVAFPTFYFPPN